MHVGSKCCPIWSDFVVKLLHSFNAMVTSCKKKNLSRHAPKRFQECFEEYERARSVELAFKFPRSQSDPVLMNNSSVKAPSHDLKDHLNDLLLMS